MIYIAVWVHYDYSRFQTNFYASTDKDKVLKYIEDNPTPSGYDFDGKIPLYEYPAKHPPSELYTDEIEHWWIQEFQEEI